MRWRRLHQFQVSLLVFVIVIPMLVSAQLAGDTVLIFPEGAALALGVLALRLPDWTTSSLRLAVIPPVCAAIGVAVAEARPPRWVGEIVAITAAFVVLHVLRSRLTPSLSAAAFPLVFDVRTWLFPLTVLAICWVLAAINSLVARPSGAASPAQQPTGRLRLRVAAVGWTIAVVWIAVAGPVLGLAAAAVAPPLVVGMLERFATEDRSASTGLRHWGVIVAAAGAGGVGASYVAPAWLGGLLAVVLVLLLFASVSGPHPPALAIALIPQVAATTAVLSYAIAVAIGAAALYGAAGLANHTPFARRFESDVRR